VRPVRTEGPAHSFALREIQPSSRKSRTPTVAKEFQIGLNDLAEADLKLCIADLQEMAVAEWLQSFSSVRGPMERLGII